MFMLLTQTLLSQGYKHFVKFIVVCIVLNTINHNKIIIISMSAYYVIIIIMSQSGLIW